MTMNTEEADTMASLVDEEERNTTVIRGYD
jgi:hypothetical protein